MFRSNNIPNKCLYLFTALQPNVAMWINSGQLRYKWKLLNWTLRKGIIFRSFFFLTSFLLLNINVMACTVILKQTKRKKPLIHLSLSYFEFLLCGHGPNPRWSLLSQKETLRSSIRWFLFWDPALSWVYLEWNVNLFFFRFPQNTSWFFLPVLPKVSLKDWVVTEPLLKQWLPSNSSSLSLQLTLSLQSVLSLSVEQGPVMKSTGWWSPVVWCWILNLPVWT